MSGFASRFYRLRALSLLMGQCIEALKILLPHNTWQVRLQHERRRKRVHHVHRRVVSCSHRF